MVPNDGIDSGVTPPLFTSFPSLSTSSGGYRSVIRIFDRSAENTVQGPGSFIDFQQRERLEIIRPHRNGTVLHHLAETVPNLPLALFGPLALLPLHLQFVVSLHQLNRAVDHTILQSAVQSLDFLFAFLPFGDVG